MCTEQASPSGELWGFTGAAQAVTMVPRQLWDHRKQDSEQGGGLGLPGAFSGPARLSLIDRWMKWVPPAGNIDAGRHSQAGVCAKHA